MENQNDIEFVLLELVRHLLKRVWIIILATAVFAVGGFAISKSTKVPQYTTSCRIYIYENDKDKTYNDMVIATQLTNDCEVLVVGSSVVDKTVANLETNLGMNISSAFIQSNLSVTSESNTRILDIHFTDTDPERAALVLNEVRKVASSEIMRVTKVDAVTTVYDAKVPTTPSNIPTQRDTILAAAIGAVLSIVVLVVMFLLDDTIRSEDDVQRYLGLSTLAAIPVSEDLMTETKNVDHKKKNGFARFLKK